MANVYYTLIVRAGRTGAANAQEEYRAHLTGYWGKYRPTINARLRLNGYEDYIPEEYRDE